MNDYAYISAHEHSIRHRCEILKSADCGCFFCPAIVSPLEIIDWTDNENTALCPYCSIDSVIGSASGFPVTKDFLAKMEKHWFGMRSYDN